MLRRRPAAFGVVDIVVVVTEKGIGDREVIFSSCFVVILPLWFYIGGA